MREAITRGCRKLGKVIIHIVRNNIDAAEVMRDVRRASLGDHFELQCMLESEAAKYAAQRRTNEDLYHVEMALIMRGDYNSSLGMDEFLGKHMHFHMAVVQASHNEAMQALYSYFSISMRRKIQAKVLLRDLLEPKFAAHQAIYEAITNKDDIQA